MQRQTTTKGTWVNTGFYSEATGRETHIVSCTTTKVWWYIRNAGAIHGVRMHNVVGSARFCDDFDPRVGQCRLLLK
jgi:ribosomal protein S19E (S16A)